MFIENHSLSGTFGGRSVKQLHCNKHSGRLLHPDMIILHYTGGADALSSAHHLARPDTDVSAHLVIARDGGIIQLLPFDTVAWHAGRSAYEGRTNLNRYSIGIEMDNAGQLHRREGRFYSWFNREYMPDEVYTDCENGRARYWHNYTLEQLQSVFAVCKLLLITLSGTLWGIRTSAGARSIRARPSRWRNSGTSFCCIIRRIKLRSGTEIRRHIAVSSPNHLRIISVPKQRRTGKASFQRAFCFTERRYETDFKHK